VSNPDVPDIVEEPVHKPPTQMVPDIVEEPVPKPPTQMDVADIAEEPVPKPPTPMDVPDIVALQTPAPTPIVIVKPVTARDLAGLTLLDQEQLLFQRTRQLHEQEAHKAFIAKLMGQQNVIVETEKETDMDLEDQQGYLNRLMRDKGDGNHRVEKRSVKETRNQPPVLEDNIGYDPNDDLHLEEYRAELERNISSEVSKNLEKSASDPSSRTRKRKLSEMNTPSVGMIYPKESPPKKSKSNPEATPSHRPKKSLKQKCYICTFEEMKLWSTDPKDREKQYCYHCHTTAIVSEKTGREGLNCCSYKPATGGRPCFRKNMKDVSLCSEHVHIAQVSEMEMINVEMETGS
jgi:hypothetical protein